MHSFDRSVVKPAEGATPFAVGFVPVSRHIHPAVHIAQQSVEHVKVSVSPILYRAQLQKVDIFLIKTVYCRLRIQVPSVSVSYKNVNNGHALSGLCMH